jgi:hypothetical protein
VCVTVCGCLWRSKFKKISLKSQLLINSREYKGVLHCKINQTIDRLIENKQTNNNQTNKLKHKLTAVVAWWWCRLSAEPRPAST